MFNFSPPDATVVKVTQKLAKKQRVSTEFMTSLSHMLGITYLSQVQTGLSKQCLIVLGFNDTSTLMGHFVSSPRERER